MGRKKKVRQRYFLPSNEGPIEVTEEIYYAYYGSRDQERELDKFYLRRCYSIDEIKDDHSQSNAEVQAILYKEAVNASEDYHQKLIEEVLRRVSLLSESDRFVIELRFYDDMTQEEIAAILNTSRRNVGFIIKRIIEKLKKLG